MSFFYPSIISTIFDTLFRQINSLAPPESLDKFRALRSNIQFWLWAIQFTFVGMVALISFFLSHRIAGPVYKLTKSMDEAKTKAVSRIFFRTHDHFKEAADQFNELMKAQDLRAEKAQAHLLDAMNKASQPEVKDALDKANQILETFRLPKS